MLIIIKKLYINVIIEFSLKVKWENTLYQIFLGMFALRLESVKESFLALDDAPK